jgi:DNA-binding GntR family transcriptional regulator
LGTQEQANIVITAAESTIVQINNNNPGIVLTSAKDLLQRAIDARDVRMFTEAERLADQANDAAIATGREHAAAQEALANAEAQINSAAAGGGSGLDNAVTMQMLEQANNEFAIGNYTEARNSAQDAVTALGDKSAQTEIPIPLMIAAIAVAAAAVAGGIGAIVFFRKRRRSKPVPELHKANDLQPKATNTNNNNISSRVGAVFRPTNSVPAGAPKQDIVQVEDEHQERAGSVEEETTTSIPPMPGTISDSQIDSSILSHIVGNILVERPHLRPEDQQVLKFLAEKEGAAFESEIRSKFQLPKTTIWRLVKRLEREELVEIRKAGGQNLIKLRFEDKQA